jgi:LAS superfamily LD-carboxypeptidase LdcB
VTVLMAALSVMVSVAVAVLATEIAEGAALKTRAQAAADAAALAAVAESGPYGNNVQKIVAREYADANGARLIECKCESWATAVQVMVELGGAQARARAVIDPEALAPARAWAGASRLHPALGRAVEALIKASAGRVLLVSGYRSTERQSDLWADALAKYGDPEVADNWVAPPGRSMHERGLAVDLGGDLDLAVSLVDELQLPLWRPLANEPWHFELVGSRD